jgi:hypothetical protein
VGLIFLPYSISPVLQHDPFSLLLPAADAPGICLVTAHIFSVDPWFTLCRSFSIAQDSNSNQTCLNKSRILLIHVCGKSVGGYVFRYSWIQRVTNISGLCLFFLSNCSLSHERHECNQQPQTHLLLALAISEKRQTFLTLPTETFY